MGFGKWLREARAEAGYSLRELAERTGGACSFGYISQLEKETTGKKGREYQPDEEIVDALADALHRDRDEARIAAGYAPEGDVYLGKPKNLSELLTVLESIPGFEGINFAESFTSEDLNNLSPDAFQEVVQAVELGIKVVLERQKRRLLSQSPTYAQDQPRPDRR